MAIPCISIGYLIAIFIVLIIVSIVATIISPEQIRPIVSFIMSMIGLGVLGWYVAGWVLECDSVSSFGSTTT